MKQSRIREWEENNGLINFIWGLMRRKKAREIEHTRETQIITSNFLKIGND